jgi:fatty-acyl-CoA synthase
LLILFTSGTTGLPKGAVISHRTEISRSMLRLAEFGLPRTAVSAVWAPLYHMAGIEEALSTLLYGGHAMLLDGFDPAQLAGIVAEYRLGWLRLMPGMITPLIGEMRRRRITPRGMTRCGTMADLVPAHQIAEVTSLLGAPYVNSFGSTETGMAPCSAGLISVGEVPSDLAKTQTAFCELRLVNAEDRDVAEGAAGEAAVRGPTVFSGYWNAPEVTAHDFCGGWFHMGDMFRRRADGKLEFVDRVKYLIKSGGENINSPAEIERVLLTDPRVADVIVVRRPDARWGEIPVAVVARKSSDLIADDFARACRATLAGYKQPKGYHFVVRQESLDGRRRSKAIGQGACATPTDRPSGCWPSASVIQSTPILKTAASPIRRRSLVCATTGRRVWSSKACVASTSRSATSRASISAYRSTSSWAARCAPKSVPMPLASTAALRETRCTTCPRRPPATRRRASTL